MSDLSKFDHIATSVIVTDIADTQAEIDSYDQELAVLTARSRTENRLRIFMLESRILERKQFNIKLNDILEYRKNQ